MPDRRSFLASLGAALGASALGCSPGAGGGRPATADTTTGARRLGTLGVQLYTVRDAMQRSVEDTLERVARIGYREVEFAGYFGRSPARIRELVAANGLVAPSAHVGLDEQHLAAALDDAAAAGHRYVVVPWIDAAQRRTGDDLRRLAEFFNRAAGEAERRGLHLAYHNHDFEFVPLYGELPYDILLGETDPTLVTFELDVYWATKAGQDPLAWFARHPGRFSMLHLKDSDGPPAHRMTEVGSGTIDWRPILARRVAAGVRHVFVEHDQPADPFASIETSYRYLSGLAV